MEQHKEEHAAGWDRKEGERKNVCLRVCACESKQQKKLQRRPVPGLLLLLLQCCCCLRCASAAAQRIPYPPNGFQLPWPLPLCLSLSLSKGSSGPRVLPPPLSLSALWQAGGIATLPLVLETGPAGDLPLAGGYGWPVMLSQSIVPPPPPRRAYRS